MRICLVTGIFPPDAGGPATFTYSIAKALVGRGHDVTVITLADDIETSATVDPCPVVRLRRTQGRGARWPLTIRAVLRSGRDCDVLFVNGLALEAALANLVLRKPLVLKVVGDLAWEWATNRGWLDDSFETFQRSRYPAKVEAVRALRAWWTRRGHRVIVPSAYLADVVVRWGLPRGRVAVIHNGVDTEGEVSPVDLPLRSRVRIVTVSRLVPWKCLDGVIAAVAQINDAGLVIVGDGPERQRLEALARSLGVGDRVYFAGRLSRGEVLRVMKSCDVFLLNSTYEGLPHVVLEAMSLGLPVVATAAGGTVEILGQQEAGILVAPGDSLALSSALTQLVSDAALRRELGARGRRRVFDQFNFVDTVEQTEMVLQAAGPGMATR